MRKKHPKLFKILMALGISATVWGTFISTDAILAANQKAPVFAIQLVKSENSTLDIYIGLFYVVYYHERPSGCIPEDPACRSENIITVEIHDWFYRGI